MTGAISSLTSFRIIGLILSGPGAFSGLRVVLEYLSGQC